jgi:guanylate kinase
MNSKIILFIGRAGSGKSTIEKKISLNLGYRRLITYTTREKRDGEKEGVDYYYTSSNNFKNLDIVASFIAREDLMYGVTKSKLKELKGTFFANVISISYGMEIINAANELGIETEIVFLDVSRDIRVERMKLRGESQESIDKRISIEEEEGLITESSLRNSFPNSSLVVLDASKSIEDVFFQYKEEKGNANKT